MVGITADHIERKIFFFGGIVGVSNYDLRTIGKNYVERVLFERKRYALFNRDGSYGYGRNGYGYILRCSLAVISYGNVLFACRGEIVIDHSVFYRELSNAAVGINRFNRHTRNVEFVVHIVIYLCRRAFYGDAFGFSYKHLIGRTGFCYRFKSVIARSGCAESLRILIIHAEALE